jgi:ribonuclease P protein component
MKRNSFNKKEKLKSEKEISRLFKNGKFLFTADFKAVFIKNDTSYDSGVKFAVSVPKKHFKRAVDRNRIKRQIRENFRLLKPILYNNFEDNFFSIHLMIIYNKNFMPDFNSIKIQMEILLKKVISKY